MSWPNSPHRPFRSAPAFWARWDWLIAGLLAIGACTVLARWLEGR